MNEHNLDGFDVNVFKDEDGDFVAQFVEMTNILAFADTREKALMELSEVWSLTKESYIEDGEDIPTPSEVSEC